MSGASNAERLQLLSEVDACLDEWARAQAGGVQIGDARLTRIRTRTAQLQPRLRTSGCSAIADGLEAMVRRVDAQAGVGHVSRAIPALTALVGQARASVASVQSGHPAPAVRGASARWEPLSPQARPSQDAGPPQPPIAPGGGLGQSRRTVRLGDSGMGNAPAAGAHAPPAGAHARPPPLMNSMPPVNRSAPALMNSASGSQAVPPPLTGPPMLDSAASAGAAPGASPIVPPLVNSLAPHLHQPGAAASGGAPKKGLHPARGGSEARFSLSSGGQPTPPPPINPSILVPRAQAAGGKSGPPGPSRQLSAAEPPKRAANAPNLGVKTMFGLRAFGSRKPRSNSTPPPQQNSGPARGAHESFNLRRSPKRLSKASAAPPPLLDRPLAGLPPLPKASDLPSENEGGRARADRENNSVPRMSRLHMLGDIVRSRTSFRSGKSAGSALIHNRDQDKGGWRVGAIVIAVLVLVTGGLATLVIVVTRNSDEAERGGLPVASASSLPGSAASAALPRSRLLTEDEAVRALLTQVHGRGRESSELRVLVDEEASLIAASMSKKECQGSPVACQAWAKLHSSILGPDSKKPIKRRRSAGSPDRVRSSWLVGLKSPTIPVADDRRVQRSLEFYTENPVGRETFQGMLFRCGAYKDLIQSTLVRYGLPTDLWAIVFVESSCSPQATSPVGAAGLWQFMPATARAYHLRVKEDVIDERRSPPKSTEAAVRFLRDLRDKLSVYDERGVWDLMFASYNMGPFGMVARIERAGGEGIGFWDLVEAEMLPDETENYAPAIQAVALILNNLQKFKFAAVQMHAPQLTSDLKVPAGTRLSLVARSAATSVNDLKSLNLDVQGETTPEISGFAIQVPKDVVWQARDTLKELMATRSQMDKCVPPSFDWGRRRFTKAMEKACRRKLGASAK